VVVVAELELLVVGMDEYPGSLLVVVVESCFVEVVELVWEELLMLASGALK